MKIVKDPVPIWTLLCNSTADLVKSSTPERPEFALAGEQKGVYF
jgi:hypothetical protein